MSLRDHLNLTGVTVTRKTVTIDSYGDPVSTSVTTTLPVAGIWSPSQNDRFLSDKIARASTHVLATVPEDYTFADSDVSVAYGGNTYRIVGPADNIAFRGIINVVGMERIS